MSVSLRAMIARTTSLLLWLALGLGCKKSEPAAQAPVVDGSWMVFQVNESRPMDSVQWDLRLDFAQKGPFYELRFQTTDPGPKAGPVKLDGQLVPPDNVISAYSLGRIWLPPEGRANGKRTPCGTVGKKKKWQQWEVYPVQGLCGTAQGNRFYEASTGMMVGFQFSGAVEFIGIVKASG